MRDAKDERDWYEFLPRDLDRKAKCRCGSGRQYKACCYAADRRREAQRHEDAERRARSRVADTQVMRSGRSRINHAILLAALLGGR